MNAGHSGLAVAVAIVLWAVMFIVNCDLQPWARAVCSA